MSKTYKDQREKLKETQGGRSKQEIMDWMQKKTEYQLDLDNMHQEHHVVDRGVVQSCEGAGHPSHRFYKQH
jgi:hypothetical protein